jgi:hypothetical protein
MDRSYYSNIQQKKLVKSGLIGIYPKKSEIPYSIMDVIDIMKPHRDLKTHFGIKT